MKSSNEKPEKTSFVTSERQKELTPSIVNEIFPLKKGPCPNFYKTAIVNVTIPEILLKRIEKISKIIGCSESFLTSAVIAKGFRINPKRKVTDLDEFLRKLNNDVDAERTNCDDESYEYDEGFHMMANILIKKAPLLFSNEETIIKAISDFVRPIHNTNAFYLTGFGAICFNKKMISNEFFAYQDFSDFELADKFKNMAFDPYDPKKLSLYHIFIVLVFWFYTHHPMELLNEIESIIPEGDLEKMHNDNSEIRFAYDVLQTMVSYIYNKVSIGKRKYVFDKLDGIEPFGINIRHTHPLVVTKPELVPPSLLNKDGKPSRLKIQLQLGKLPGSKCAFAIYQNRYDLTLIKVL